MAFLDIDRLERVLIQAAREGRPVSYRRLLAYFGRPHGPANVARLCRDLGAVGERTRARGEPELACLVVREKDGLPGQGYFNDLLPAGVAADGPEARRLVAERQQAAFAFWAAADAAEVGAASPWR